MNTDVSIFPKFKESVLSMVNEMQVIYDSDLPVANKAAAFDAIFRKYECA